MPRNILVVDGERETSVIALGRAKRGIEGFQINPNLLDIPPIPCGTDEFMGLPLVDKPCPLRPGNEEETTAEYARYENGQLIYHPSPLFPASSGWEMRAIDNKFPIFDERDFFSGEDYREGYMAQRKGFLEMDAIGKDYMIIYSSHHVQTANHLDFLRILNLEREFARREIEKEHVQYVQIFRNNAGLPRRKLEPLSGSEYYEIDGSASGASQAHPHGRVLSMHFLPEKLLRSYERKEERMEESSSDIDDDFVIKNGEEFVLMADPAPRHSGSLVVVARNARNILEISDTQLEELGNMIQLGQRLVDVRYDGVPSNVYFRQIFDKTVYVNGNGDEIDLLRKYPHYRMYVRIDPRTSVWAGLELATGIVAVTTAPADVRNTMKYLMETYQLG